MGSEHDAIREEMLALTRRILEAIHKGDVETYRELCAPDLTCFEADVAPYRIDGVDFHVDLMRTMAARGSYGNLVRFDMLTPSVQVYDGCSVVTYTRLMTYGSATDSPEWRAYNESRVYARVDGAWKMVHFHRSNDLV